MLNTATNTTQPCSTPPTVTVTPPLVTEAPIKDQFPEVGFYFHNDFPDPNNSTKTDASAPYDTWLTSNILISLKRQIGVLSLSFISQPLLI